MKYDTDYVTKWRAHAITDVTNLEVGKTYYSNNHGAFTLKRLMTRAQYYEEEGIKGIPVCYTANEVCWMEVAIHDGAYLVVYSLRDNNVGASYNPWLIFRDQATMEEYKAGLEVTVDNDFWCDDSWGDLPSEDEVLP